MPASRTATIRPEASDQETGGDARTTLFPLSNVLDQPSMSVSAAIASAPEGIRLRLTLDPGLLERGLGGPIDEPAVVSPPSVESGSANVGISLGPKADPPLAALEERRLRVKAAKGSMKHVPGSVDEFLREKHQEVDREEASWKRHRKR